MATYQYTTTTDFDKELKLEITETNDGRKTEFRYKGFRNINEAQRYAKWWEDMWHWGYNGSATAITDTTGDAVVLASRWNSCD
jgi:hypothetical protein